MRLVLTLSYLCFWIGSSVASSSDELSTAALVKKLELLETIAQKLKKRNEEQNDTITKLTKTMEGHLNKIESLQKEQNDVHDEIIKQRQQNRKLGSRCDMDYKDDMCVLSEDMKVDGDLKVKDAFYVAAPDCDDCIIFNRDAHFRNDVDFIDDVEFFDDVTFRDDVTIEGGDSSGDTTDFEVKEYVKMKFDQKKPLIVESETYFQHDVHLLEVKTSSSDEEDPANLYVEGNIFLAGDFDKTRV